ncbi:RNA-binding KH domain-containing protein PEPPER-like [Phoenix dactylifera]|uniref:RNA-binding KH domain-containing protein PEPPER-like n=1 Tax=Phoenix dactylifera TaxID=42345 RepID=A0A8B7CA31_PHODC|nr:RNA-binding KH domain-containing protein PEPPER-like [Phoenix dactylifera]
MEATPTDTSENNGAAAADPAPEAEAPAASPAEVEDPEEDPEPSTEEEMPSAADATPAPAPAQTQGAESKKWPGWPGDNVFRLVVPVLKVGSIIGRRGELIKKLCEETRARVRILEGALGTSDRIVLISAREEPDAEISPAMDAVLRVFKRINGMTDSGGDGTTPASATPTCSVRLLVASSQAINLIGKQGTLIKSIQETSGATVRVLSRDELPFYATADERIVEIQGESLKVVRALESTVGHLRKFLVDHSVLPLFEKSFNAPATQDRPVDAWADKAQSLIHASQQAVVGNDYAPPLKRESLFLDRESQLDPQIPRSGLSLYGQDPALSGLRSSALGRSGALVTQVTQTMQIPLSYAEDIIGIGGGNIAYIRRNSGAILTVQESRGLPDEITVEIKGTASQVQVAQQLIQEFISGHKEPLTSSYGGLDTGMRSSYSQLASTGYPSSSLASQSLGGYGSSGLGGYGGYRL